MTKTSPGQLAWCLGAGGEDRGSGQDGKVENTKGDFVCWGNEEIPFVCVLAAIEAFAEAFLLPAAWLVSPMMM